MRSQISLRVFDVHGSLAALLRSISIFFWESTFLVKLFIVFCCQGLSWIWNTLMSAIAIMRRILLYSVFFPEEFRNSVATGRSWSYFDISHLEFVILALLGPQAKRRTPSKTRQRRGGPRALASRRLSKQFPSEAGKVSFLAWFYDSGSCTINLI